MVGLSESAAKRAPERRRSSAASVSVSVGVRARFGASATRSSRRVRSAPSSASPRSSAASSRSFSPLVRLLARASGRFLRSCSSATVSGGRGHRRGLVPRRLAGPGSRSSAAPAARLLVDVNRSPSWIGQLADHVALAVHDAQAEEASDSSLFSVSGYFRTSQIKAAACSSGLLRPCPNARASGGSRRS